MNISFVLFPQASEPSMNFNIAKMIYWMARMHDYEEWDYWDDKDD